MCFTPCLFLRKPTYSSLGRTRRRIAESAETSHERRSDPVNGDVFSQLPFYIFNRIAHSLDLLELTVGDDQIGTVLACPHEKTDLAGGV